MAALHSTGTSPLSQAPPPGYILVPVSSLYSLTRRFRKLLYYMEEMRFTAESRAFGPPKSTSRHHEGELPGTAGVVALPVRPDGSCESGESGRLYRLSETGLLEEEAILARHGVRDLAHMLDNASSTLIAHCGMLGLMAEPENDTEAVLHALLESLGPVQKAVADMAYLWHFMDPE